ncbi:MAG: hypothetical protein ABIG87_01305 [Patescibacteria group bacterium]
MAETGSKIKVISFYIVVLIVIFMMITVGIGMYKKQQPRVSLLEEKVDLAQIQERLGSDWRMVVLGPGETFGPKKLKNGTGWEIVQGEIWIKVNNEKPFLDQSDNKHRTVGGGKIFFSNASKDKAIFFFKS